MKSSPARKRLLLINPTNPYTKGLTVRRESLQAPLGLAVIAALTPSDWEIRITDENFKKFKFREADLVGISALTATANRAYEIAAEYRSKGIPVIIGGVHATLIPDEVAHYADCVVTGEVEPVWSRILTDFEAGTLQPRYAGYLADMSASPIPRHDLLHPGYLFGTVQTTRGCPMNCDFCTVPTLNGHEYRLRKVSNVLDELERIPQKLIYFVDDNMIGANKESHDHAMAIFQGMVDRKIDKEWFGYVSLNVGTNEELVKLAAASGCKMMLIGIESEKVEQLRETNKKMNLKIGPENYRKVVRILHKYQICALGTFIFGLDHDRPEDLVDRIYYMKRSPFDVTQGTVLTPFPGTGLFNRLQDEDRLLCKKFPESWKHFHGTDIVFRPKLMEPSVLAETSNLLIPVALTRNSFILRFIRTWWNTKSYRAAIWAYATNMNYRMIALDKKFEVCQ